MLLRYYGTQKYDTVMCTVTVLALVGCYTVLLCTVLVLVYLQIYSINSYGTSVYRYQKLKLLFHRGYGT